MTLQITNNVLTDLEKLLSQLSPDKKQELTDLVINATKDSFFTPNPGPQSRAYFSEADILLFGGQPGGGKSGLINGLALNEHYNSLIVRRQFTDLQGIVRDCRKMITDSGHDLKGFVMGNRPKYRKANGGELSFEGVEINGEIDYGKQGVARDFIGIDEGAQLPLDAILMLYGWNRSTTPNQRCRMVIASNPPVNSTGAWLAEFFAPWLDSDYPNPAEDGEIRYFWINEDSKSIEFDSKEPFEHNGTMQYPHSRTFIKSTLADNPYLSVEYQSKLQTLPEPYRSILLTGNFLSFRTDQDNQVIPTDWVREAMARRDQYPKPPEGMPLCNIGVDIAQGGKDSTVISRRYDWWFDDLIVKEGKDTPMGRDVAGLIMSHYRDSADVTLDMSGGFGSGVWECLQEVIGRQNLHAFKGGETAIYRTKEGTYGFTNTRSAGYWRLREALDPTQNGGSAICLPNDKKLLHELTAPTFEVTSRGIKVIPKDELIKNIGYSPDRADAVVMSYYFGSIGLSQNKRQNNKNVLKVNLGYSQRKKTK